MKLYIDRRVDGTRERPSLIGCLWAYLDNHMFHRMLARSALGKKLDTARRHQEQF